MIHITIDAETPEGLHSDLRKLLNGAAPAVLVPPSTIPVGEQLADKVVTASTEQADVGKPAPRGRAAKKDEPKGNISTQPEDRKPPADSAETQAQDAADEKGTDAPKDVKTFVHDDVRNALGEYVKKFGMPAALEDGPKVIGMVLGAKADGTSWKTSEIPDDQAKLAKIVAGAKEMTDKNPFKRDLVTVASEL